MRPVVVAGCGDLGSSVGVRLVAGGRSVWGIRRRVAAIPGEITAVAAELTATHEKGGTDSSLLPNEPVTLIYSVTPDERTEDAYDRIYRRALERTLEAMPVPPAQLIFVSSTAVYDVTGGEWVDETSPATAGGRGGVLRAAEEVGLQSETPTTVVRAAGIYGPGRTSLIERVGRGEAIFEEDEPTYTNRIHRDDLANLIAAIAVRAETDVVPEIVCAVDDEPAPRADVNRFIARLLNVPPTSAPGYEAPSRSHKRVKSLHRSDLGPGLLRPTYREGYRALIAEGG